MRTDGATVPGPRRCIRRSLLGLAVALSATLAVPARAQDPKVVVTIKPMHSLAAAVMEGVGTPRLLIDGTASPHTFTLKPSDAKALNEAAVIFRVSEGLEPYTSRLARSLPRTVRLVTLESVPGLTLLSLRKGGNFEAHDHGGDKHGHAHGHGHGHGHGHAKDGRDGHVWLDPGNASLIAAYMAQVLAEIMPAHAERLRANAAALAKSIDALVPEIEARLKPVANRPFVVFHDAYQYFERRFGLAAIGSVTVSPEVPPSARRLTALRRKISGLKAACVFAEPQFEPRIVASIVEGTTARKGVLDPLGAAIEAGPGHYPRLLRALADDLAGCLASPS